MSVFNKKIAICGPYHAHDPSVYSGVLFAWGLMGRGFSVDWYSTTRPTCRASGVIQENVLELASSSPEEIRSRLGAYKACFFLQPNLMLLKELNAKKIKAVFIPQERFLDKTQLTFGTLCDQVWLNERLMSQLPLIYQTLGWKYLQLQCGLESHPQEEAAVLRVGVVAISQDDLDALRLLESKLCMAFDRRVELSLIRLSDYESDIRRLAAVISEKDVIVDLSFQDSDVVYMLASLQGKLLLAADWTLAAYERNNVVKFSQETMTYSMLTKVLGALIRQGEREASEFWTAVGALIK